MDSFLPALLLALLLGTVHGAVYVDLNSNCGSLCLGTSSSPYPTILGGLGAIPNGGWVIVNDGVYKGFGNKNLNISSAYTWVSSVNGPGKTIIDCEGDGYGIDLFSGTFNLTGFTIKNCVRNFQNPSRSYAQEGVYGGGAISIHSTDTLLFNLILYNNTATGFGGAIYSWSNNVEIHNSTITNNQANSLGGGVFVASASLALDDDTVIENNKALWTNVSSNGKDLFCISGSVTLDQTSDVSGLTCVSCQAMKTQPNNKAANVCPTSGATVGIRVSWEIVVFLVGLLVVGLDLL